EKSVDAIIALGQAEAGVEGSAADVATMLDFIAAAKRGLVR
ncbi:MAG: hypothetical protein RL722_581, partial [Pseudomonadota bacterium]